MTKSDPTVCFIHAQAAANILFGYVCGIPTIQYLSGAFKRSSLPFSLTWYNHSTMKQEVKFYSAAALLAAAQVLGLLSEPAAA